MINCFVNNEFSLLDTVILGIANDFGGTPLLSDTYDPKSRQSIIKNNFPIESDLINALNQVLLVFEKYNINVYRPDNIKDCNQIFTRDVGFVIENKFFKSNVINDRKEEINGLSSIINHINSNEIISIPDDISVEGGDVIVHNDYIFCGYSNSTLFNKFKVCRTSENILDFISNVFSSKKVIGFELIKSDTDPHASCLHLDCCFQPLGLGHVIVCPEAFRNLDDVQFINDVFGVQNIININLDEMSHMYSNIFSISKNVVISDIKFKRLNNILIKKGYTVETVSFSEVSKMGGLLRCATLPLKRSL